MTYSPDDFANIKSPPKEAPADIQWDNNIDAEAAYKKALANGLTKKAAKLLNSHGDARYGSASEADFAVMGYLHRTRLTPSENAAVIFAHPRGDDISQRHPNVWEYMKLSLSKIYSTNDNQNPAEDAPPGPYSLAQVETIFNKWLLFRDHRALRSVLSGVAAHRAGGDGIWLFIVDAPGSGKTETIQSINNLGDVFPLSSLTSSTFASGQRMSDSAKDPSLLLRLPSECIVTLKDFTTILSMRHDNRQEILAQLRELADGSYVKEFGNGKTVSWEGRMCFIAGVTPAIDTHWAVNQALGERFVQVRPQAPDPLKVASKAMANVGREETMRQELQAAMTRFLDNLEYPPIGQIVLTPQMEQQIQNLATFACRARSAIMRDGYQQEITYIPVPEGPARLAKQLNTLARGRAIIGHETQLSESSFREIVQIGMDCIPPQRHIMLQALISREEPTTTTISEMTGYPVNSARRILEELMAIKLVSRTLAANNAYQWRLSKEAKQWYTSTLQ